MSQLIQITDIKGRQLDTAPEAKPLDLAEVRAKLAASKGQAYWRSLEEVAAQPGFGELLQREFPGQAPANWAPLARRDFVRLMGAALALAGLSGCAFQPQEKIVPYVKQPEEIVPGIPLYYASAALFSGYALGVLAESHEGRPTKIEGNPDHSSSLGATDQWAQASVLDLYDPDRSQSVLKEGQPTSWDELAGTFTSAIEKTGTGGGVALLTGTITSPTLLAQIADVRKRLPGFKWYVHEPINRSNVHQGAALAFGKPAAPVYNFRAADVIVSLDCDFLLEEPGRVSHAREFIAGRRLSDKVQMDGDGKAVVAPDVSMNRLYAIESTPTISGAAADHRLPVKASAVEGIARYLAAGVGVPGVQSEAPEAEYKKFLDLVAADLKDHRGRVLVCAGAHQPPAVHALAFAITSLLGSVGPQAAIAFATPFEGRPDGDLKDLSDRMSGVTHLMMLGTNPVYTAPGDIDFKTELLALIRRGGIALHQGAYVDETTQCSNWHVPAAHSLEYWGDARSHDGALALIQPMIQPLYAASKAPSQLLALLAGSTNSSDYDLLRSYWQSVRPNLTGIAFDKFWQRAVHDGLITDYAPAASVSLSPGLGAALGPAVAPPAAAKNVLEVNFRPDPTIWDGRFANNGWLQEVPKSVSKITWDNAIFVAPKLAFAKGLATNDRVRITVGKKFVEGAVFLLPGQPDNTITVHLGYGRTAVGKIGQGCGFDAAPIRSSAEPWFAKATSLEGIGGIYKIATTTTHNLISAKGKNTTWGDALLGDDDAKTKVVDNIITPETRDLDMDGLHGRDLVRVGTLEELKAKLGPVNPKFDWRGLPFAYPANPDKVRKLVAMGKEDDFPTNKDRDAEGQPQFYPRESDLNASQQYVDKKLSAELNSPRGEKLYAWGMSVDLQSCIGCNACVIGCQSENNSAIVGKDQVLMGREMHWIRIDTYYRGSYENPEVYFEPMMCQHCEKAPCAPVCPFNATMNSPEGINEQVYNRCVGTKYCENNCPYKVRRFNFLQYSDQQTPVIQLMANPDVTVRSRGVMEKCTYCIQRVNAAKWQAEKENRRVQDGEIKTACQQACPTNAIVFGNINQENSKVSQLKFNPLNFGLLTEHNTMPRTTYLARIKNPNPVIAKLGDEFEVESMAGEHPLATEGAEEKHSG